MTQEPLYFGPAEMTTMSSPPGREALRSSRLVATVCLAVAACGLCAAVLGSQDGRGHNELESADASLIRALAHSGTSNVHNEGEPARNLNAEYYAHTAMRIPSSDLICPVWAFSS